MFMYSAPSFGGGEGEGGEGEGIFRSTLTGESYNTSGCGFSIISGSSFNSTENGGGEGGVGSKGRAACAGDECCHD